MVEKTVEVQLNPGLQARLAAKFVQEATKYASQIFLLKDGRTVNAKSIMGLMSLVIVKGEEIGLRVEGTDEEEALDALVQFVTQEG